MGYALAQKLPGSRLRRERGIFSASLEVWRCLVNAFDNRESLVRVPPAGLPAPRLGERLTLLTALVSLYLICYWVVTRLTAAAGPDALFDTRSSLDPLIPYVPATWPLYWLAYPFVVFGGGAAALRLPGPAFHRAVGALAAMTVTGAVIQLLLPARAPWPADPAAMQRYLHASALMMPYATLPSMHVAYCTVAAGLMTRVTRRRAVRVIVPIIVAAVAISTLTLREHVVLDATTGLALGLLTVAWWRRGIG